MNTKLQKLEAKKTALDAQIKALRDAEKTERRAASLKLIERAGLLDLDAAALQDKLGELLTKATAPKAGQDGSMA